MGADIYNSLSTVEIWDHLYYSINGLDNEVLSASGDGQGVLVAPELVSAGPVVGGEQDSWVLGLPEVLGSKCRKKLTVTCFR